MGSVMPRPRCFSRWLAFFPFSFDTLRLLFMILSSLLLPLPFNKVTPTPSPTSSTKPSSETKHGRISVKRALVEMLVWTSLESLGTLSYISVVTYLYSFVTDSTADPWTETSSSSALALRSLSCGAMQIHEKKHLMRGQLSHPSLLDWKAFYRTLALVHTGFLFRFLFLWVKSDSTREACSFFETCYAHIGVKLTHEKKPFKLIQSYHLIAKIPGKRKLFVLEWISDLKMGLGQKHGVWWQVCKSEPGSCSLCSSSCFSNRHKESREYGSKFSLKFFFKNQCLKAANKPRSIDPVGQKYPLLLLR